jgi:hypothetical protein
MYEELEKAISMGNLQDTQKFYQPNAILPDIYGLKHQAYIIVLIQSSTDILKFYQSKEPHDPTELLQNLYDELTPEPDEKTKYLLSIGANPNAQDANGQTPLHKAAYNNYATSCQTLVKAGANPTILDKQNRLPVHMSTNPETINATNPKQTTNPLCQECCNNNQTSKNCPSTNNIPLDCPFILEHTMQKNT